MRLSRRCTLFGVCIVLLGSLVIASPSAAETQQEPLEVKKIYFMFHPVCWQLHGPNPPPTYKKRPHEWTNCYNWELRVNERQKEFMRKMKPDEVLVLFPIGSIPAMRELEECATKTLGRRAIIVRRGSKDPPPAWADLDDPFERFLTDPNLEGRAKFLEGCPPEIQEELAGEIRQARKEIGTNWNIAVFEVIYYSRLCAMDLKEEFKNRKLHYDPATVGTESFGEGFEQCAVTWKQMLVPYLGLANPPPNIFDLSVSGLQALVAAKLTDRVKLDEDIYLYLWEGSDGRKIALAIRAWCRLKDPQFHLRVPVAGMTAEVRNVSGKQCYPNPDGPELELKVTDGHLELPVLKGIRRDSTGPKVAQSGEMPCYLLAEGISTDEFRRRMVEARIVQTK